MPKNRPFKKVYCDRPEVFRLPPAAFKVWMYHYIREGQDRKSWCSLPTICKALDMDESTVKRARKFLMTNGWLKKTGERDSHGAFKVPVMMVTRGTIPTEGVQNTTPAIGAKSPSEGVQNAPAVGGAKSPSEGVQNAPAVGGAKCTTEVDSKSKKIQLKKSQEVDSERQEETDEKIERVLDLNKQASGLCLRCQTEPKFAGSEYCGVCKEEVEYEEFKTALQARARNTPKTTARSNSYERDSNIATEGFDESRVPPCPVCGKKCDWDDSTDEGFNWVYSTCNSDACQTVEAARQRREAMRILVPSAPRCRLCGNPPSVGEQVCADCRTTEQSAAEFDAVEQAEMTGVFA